MMKIFKNIEEMKPYYNEKTNTYEFIENGCPIDIVIDFGLFIASHIYAKDIKAIDIKAHNIKARDISAFNIRAWDISAEDINADDINARNIIANKISFNAVCFAYETFVCNAIKGTRKNSKYFCLDSEIVIRNK